MVIYKLAKAMRLGKDDIIIDIGANIGMASVPICSENDIELFAVEASKINIPLLAKNIYENEVKATINVVALTDKADTDFIEFYVNKSNTGASSIQKDWNPNVNDRETKEYVKAITLDNLIKCAELNLSNAKLIKIDVEGAEEMVLKGGINFLKDNTAPIIMEYRNDAMNKYLGKDLSEVVKILKSCGYNIYALSNMYDFIEFNPAATYENVIAVKSNIDLETIFD